VNVRVPPHALQVRYDGLSYTISAVSGDVYVNNVPAVVGRSIDGSCVITMGAREPRTFLTMDVSHPQVVL
jgi:hypothetical protein